MQNADFDVSAFSPTQQSEEDKKLLVKFFIKPRQDASATKEQGRPIFKDVEYIDIKIPGNRTGGVCRPATYADKQRFPDHYSAFKTRSELPDEGTPLSEWPMVSRSQAEEMGFYNVKTVEHLASMSDTHAAKFVGIYALKAKAKTWLEQAENTADSMAMQEALDERDVRIANLEARLDELMASMPQPELVPDPGYVAESVPGGIAIPEDAASDLGTQSGIPLTDIKVETEADTEKVIEEPAKPKPRRRRTKRSQEKDGTI